MKLNQSLAARLLPRREHPTWTGKPKGTLTGSARPSLCDCGRKARVAGAGPAAGGCRRAPAAEVGAQPGQEPHSSPRTQARTRPSLRSPDLGAVLQAIRLHFVTDFWTLPPTLPPSGASSRNSPPPQDRNPFQTSDRRQEKSYIILFGQDAKKTKWGGDVVIFSCVFWWREERGVCDFAFRGRVSSRFLTGFSVPGARAAEGPEARAEENGPKFSGFSLEAPKICLGGKGDFFELCTNMPRPALSLPVQGVPVDLIECY